MMRVFQVREGSAGAILWTGEAPGEREALNTMARAAGYHDSSALPETVRNRGLAVEELSLGNSVGPAGMMRMQGGRTGRVADRSSTSARTRIAV